MARDTEVGAAAAATYLLELYGYTVQTGDVAAWDSLTWEGCAFCAQARDLALDAATSGGRIRGGDITVVTTTLNPPDEVIAGYSVDVTYLQTAGEFVHPDGTTEIIGYDDAGVLGVNLVRRGETWEVVDVFSRT